MLVLRWETFIAEEKRLLKYITSSEIPFVIEAIRRAMRKKEKCLEGIRSNKQHLKPTS